MRSATCNEAASEAAHGRLRERWGETGGTPRDKDKEIRVRTGNSRFKAVSRMSAPKRRVFYGVVEYERLVLAPQVGLEPTTLRLTAESLHATAVSGVKRCKDFCFSVSEPRRDKRAHALPVPMLLPTGILEVPSTRALVWTEPLK